MMLVATVLATTIMTATVLLALIVALLLSTAETSSTPNGYGTLVFERGGYFFLVVLPMVALTVGGWIAIRSHRLGPLLLGLATGLLTVLLIFLISGWLLAPFVSITAYNASPGYYYYTHSFTDPHVDLYDCSSVPTAHQALL
ncbi:hypothetical protein JDY09_07415 [Thermoleophilum album]|uniref:hypothetical protein n=1 Tax=Thermoleophilum album TaxID=29539 RepID=UPI00237D03F5|nr:hypothetical protein [Thermoleophilum album]WDT93210.1 hypothetical protein JDY09_07415 [Thermoleophilum album]